MNQSSDLQVDSMCFCVQLVRLFQTYICKDRNLETKMGVRVSFVCSGDCLLDWPLNGYSRGHDVSLSECL